MNYQQLPPRQMKFDLSTKQLELPRGKLYTIFTCGLGAYLFRKNET